MSRHPKWRPPTRLSKRATEHFDAGPHQIFYGHSIGVNTNRQIRRGWWFRKNMTDYFQAASFHEWQCSPAWAMKKLIGRDTF